MRIFKFFLCFLITLLTLGFSVVKVENDNLLPSDYFNEKLIFCQKIDDTTRSDFTFVGDELWSIAPSLEDNSDFNYIYRYKVNFKAQNFELIGTIKHNFGHCNSVDYNPTNDCLIFGSGSTTENDIYSRVYFVENVSK